MMFIVSKERIVRDYPVEIRQVGEDGKPQIHKLEADFKLLGRAARRELGPDKLLTEVVLGLRPIFEADGKTEITFDAALLERLLDDDAVALALAVAYAEAVQGGARRKN